MKILRPVTICQGVCRLRRCMVMVLLSASCCGTGVAQQASATQPGAATDKTAQDTAAVFQKDEVDLAMDRAVAWLQTKQREDGAIIDRGHDTTMTALAIMAMASVGVQPGSPTPAGQSMQRALAFVLKDDRVDAKGYFGDRDGSRMYGHGIITWEFPMNRTR